jgi:hypothetical protein
VLFSFHHHLKCLLSSHVILHPHFTLGIGLRACEFNQIYKGQRSRNRIVIDFTLYHTLDVGTLMSHTLDVSVLMTHEGANHAMVTSPSCEVRPLRLHPNQAISCRREFSGFQFLKLWSRHGLLPSALVAQGSWPMLLQQKYPRVQSWWAAGVSNCQDQQNENSCPSNSSSCKVAT